MRDERIVELFWQRDEGAISASAEVYGAYCRSVAQNILNDSEDAEECVNDTWLRAWNAIPPQRPKRLRMFLAKITRNLALDRCKAREAGKRGGGETLLALEELGECVGQPRVENTVFARELEAAVNRFVRGLPRRECNVFLRRYFFAEPVAEIGKKYGLSPNHVMVILSRTRKKLKAYLEKEGYL